LPVFREYERSMTTHPTVTGAHLVLGHLPPYLLDGAFALDTEAARPRSSGISRSRWLPAGPTPRSTIAPGSSPARRS
jgi:hypothetical protein